MANFISGPCINHRSTLPPPVSEANMEARSQRTARGRAHRARHHGQRASRSLWPALPPGQLRLRADGRGQQLGEGATRRDGSVMDGGFNGEEGGGGTFFLHFLESRQASPKKLAGICSVCIALELSHVARPVLKGHEQRLQRSLDEEFGIVDFFGHERTWVLGGVFFESHVGELGRWNWTLVLHQLVPWSLVFNGKHVNLVLDLLEYWFCMTICSKMRSSTCRVWEAPSLEGQTEPPSPMSLCAVPGPEALHRGSRADRLRPGCGAQGSRGSRGGAVRPGRASELARGRVLGWCLGRVDEAPCTRQTHKGETAPRPTADHGVCGFGC